MKGLFNIRRLNITWYYDRLKEEKNMILMDDEKLFDEMQQPLLINFF